MLQKFDSRDLESTSLDKATWLPQLMQWDLQDVEDTGAVPT